MTNKRIITSAVCVSLVLASAGCGKKEEEQEILADATNVTVYSVGTEYINNSVSYTGELKASDSTSNLSKVSARITKVNVDEGDYVNAGDVLAELDDTDYQNQYKSALAGYNSALAGYNSVIKSATKQASTSAKNNLTSAQLAYNQALENYNREKELYNSGSSLRLAEQSYNDAVSAYNREKQLYDSGSTIKLAEQGYKDAVTAYNREKELYDNDTALTSARNSLKTAEDNLNNVAALYEIGAASKVEYDAAVSNVDNLRASLSSLSSQKQASYDAAYSTMVKAEENLRSARLNATTALDAAYSGMVKAEENLRSTRLNVRTAYDAAKNALDNASNALSAAKENIGLTSVSNDSNIETAKASLENARTALNTAKENLENTKIRALSSGYVSSKNATVGQMASPGVELFSIKSTNSLMAEIEITESVIPYVTQGTKALVDIQSADIEDLEGVVSLVNPTKNAQTGMYTVQVDIENAEDKLNVGMFADVTLAIEESENAITVPNEAIMLEDDKRYVYMVSDDDDKIAEKRYITVGIEADDYSEVADGLLIGDRVIVTGQDYLSEENNQINIVTE